MNKLSELQQCQFDILLEIDRICSKHNIPYYLAYGTCLGAYRHHGFIPWDDDIDICMMAEDLERLKEYKEEFLSPYFLQCQETDPEYGPMIARVRDSDTTLIERTEVERDINHGVFVDIYPLFPSYENSKKATRKIICSYIYRLLLYGHAPYNHGGVVKKVANLLLKITPPALKTAIKRHTYAVMRKETNTGFVSILYGGDERVSYKKEWLFPTKKMMFEDYSLPVPGQVEKYLEYSYGDYMKLPPPEKQTVHHDYVFVDVHNSYLKYKGDYYCKGSINE